MYNSVTTNTSESTWKSLGRALVKCKWRHYVWKLKQFSKLTTKLKILERFTSMFGISDLSDVFLLPDETLEQGRNASR